MKIYVKHWEYSGVTGFVSQAGDTVTVRKGEVQWVGIINPSGIRIATPLDFALQGVTRQQVVKAFYGIPDQKAEVMRNGLK